MSALTSAEDFLSKIVAGFRAAAPVIQAAAPVVESAATVVETVVPTTAPYIAAAEGVIASASALAPNVVTSAHTIYDQIENLLQVGGSEIQQLKGLFNKAGVAVPVGQQVAAIPAVTAATVPTPAPGKALS